MKFIVLVILVPAFVQGSAWDYDRTPGTTTGPSGWTSNIAATCGGSSQSPIDIDTDSATTDSSLGDFTITGYDVISDVNLTLTNNGHSAKLTHSGGNMQVSGGDLGDTYILEQLHFHWGSADTNGSEHTIDGMEYPLEMHLVHYKNDFSSVSDAAASNESDALAVLGFLFELSDSDNTNLNALLDMLQNVTTASDDVVVPTFEIDDLFDNADLTGSYWRYSGGLTTPGCNEIVTWTVFETKIGISSSQLAKFRSLEDDNGDPIVDNFRPVQSLGDRTVKYYTTDIDTTTQGASGNLASLLVLGLAYLLTRLA